MKIKIGLNETLNQLQKRIYERASITKITGKPIDPQKQRIFFFGRELKTGSRSLETLLGRYIRISKIIHLYTSQKIVKTLRIDDNDSDDDDVVEVVDAAYSRKRSAGENCRPPKQTVVELLDSDSSDDEIEIVDESSASKKARAT
jgi:hypothetical protein